jgi:nucleoid-associated protein YgaU
MRLPVPGGFFIQKSSAHTEVVGAYRSRQLAYREKESTVSHGKHAKRVSIRKAILILFALFIGVPVLWALIYGIVNPSPGSHSPHGSQTVSAPPAVHARVPVTSPPPTAATGPSPPRARPPQGEYTVQAGDSLSSIAAKYHLHGYLSLYDANKAAVGNNPAVLHVGLRLKVPATC